MPGEENSEDFQPEIVLLYCEHCINGFKQAQLKTPGFKVRAVVLPCSSKVEVGNVLKIIEAGADGVEVAGCLEGDCRFFVGSNRAEKRVAYARSLVSDAGLGGERVGMTRGVRLDAEKLSEIVSLRAQAVKPLGPNPMRKKK